MSNFSYIFVLPFQKLVVTLQPIPRVAHADVSDTAMSDTVVGGVLRD